MEHIDFAKLTDQFLYHKDQPLIFNSGFFLFLFLGFLAVYCLIYKREQWRNVYVILFSVYFYYKSSGLYFLLLAVASLVDYNVGRTLFKTENKGKRIGLLLVSLFLNLGMLGYFKYTNFLVSVFYDILNKPFNPFDIFLPVGISFFTFQSLSYTIDIYRRNIEPARSYSEFTFFLTFFPQMVAGPVVRASEFIPQIRQTPFVSRQDFGRAVFLLCIGLFKKAIVSDYISQNFVDRIFENPMLYTGVENLFGVYGYALQIYCDFSGYTDMAIGVALLLGYKLPINFNSPYQSGSITEFWRRWHMSLSRWLRDYLYISLGGNRRGKVRMYINLMLTMLLGGLWHGAAMRFILWGGLHGLALVVEKLVKTGIGLKGNKLTHVLSVFVTFHFVCFCWIFFRADSMETAAAVLTQIATAFHGEVFFEFVSGYAGVLALMVVGYALHFVPSRIEQQTQQLVVRSSFVLKICYLAIVIFVVLQMKSSDIQPFIYFQF